MTTAMEAYRAARQGRTRTRRTPLLTALSATLIATAAFLGRRLPAWPVIRTTVLRLAGLGCINIAAFQWATWAGLLAVGISLLLLDMAGED